MTLQKDEFFLYLNSMDYYNHYDKPTRIDFLFDFICKNDFFTYDKDYVGNDQYRTFRCFYYCYKNNKKEEFEKLWDNVVKKVFNIFYEWYSDINLYHYIGYVLYLGKATLSDLYKEWNSHDKWGFLKDYLFKTIREKCLSSCHDINKDYDINKKKNEAEPLLLLHNIQTIVNQNRVMESNEKYHLGVFYKFPFHLYKKENWNIEHIDSNTENDLSDASSQKAWVLSTYTCLDPDKREKVKEDVTKFFTQKDTQGSDQNDSEEIDFDDIKREMEELIYKESKGHKMKNEKWKNRIYNYTLLDETTNKSYGNAIFPAKRMCIIDKERGRVKRATWNGKEKAINVKEEDAKSAFVPICTSKVFQRAYSANISDITVWSEDDAKAYGSDIVSTLTNVKIGDSSETFDFIENKEVKIDE